MVGSLSRGSVGLTVTGGSGQRRRPWWAWWVSWSARAAAAVMKRHPVGVERFFPTKQKSMSRRVRGLWTFLQNPISGGGAEGDRGERFFFGFFSFGSSGAETPPSSVTIEGTG